MTTPLVKILLVLFLTMTTELPYGGTHDPRCMVPIGSPGCGCCAEPPLLITQAAFCLLEGRVVYDFQQGGQLDELMDPAKARAIFAQMAALSLENYSEFRLLVSKDCLPSGWNLQTQNYDLYRCKFVGCFEDHQFAGAWRDLTSPETLKWDQRYNSLLCRDHLASSRQAVRCPCRDTIAVGTRGSRINRCPRICYAGDICGL